MEWLTNLLNASGNSSSPFGALGGGYGGPTGDIGYGTGVGATGPIPATPPQSSSFQLPGILGKLMGQQQQANGQSQQGQQNPNTMSPQQQFLLNQALGMIHGPQFQPVSWMNLLPGPGAR